MYIYIYICMYVCIVDVSYFFNTRKAEWGSFLSPNRFAKSLFSREREDEALLFVNFNIIKIISEDMKILFFDVHYFRQLVGFFDIS